MQVTEGWIVGGSMTYNVQCTPTVVIILKEMVSRDFQALSLFVKNLPWGHWFRTLKYFGKQQRIYHITVQIAKKKLSHYSGGVVDKTESKFSSITHTTKSVNVKLCQWHRWVMTWGCHWYYWVTVDPTESAFRTSKGSHCRAHFFPGSEKLVSSILARNYGGNRPPETLC